MAADMYPEGSYSQDFETLEYPGEKPGSRGINYVRST